MKVVDEKGKLFGKINLIDLMIILVVLAVIVAAVWKIAGDKVTSAVTQSETITMEYEVICTGLEKEVCDYIAEHAEGQMISNGKYVDGYVTGCKVLPCYKTWTDDEGEAIKYADVSTNTVIITCQFTTTSTDLTHALGSQEIRVGKEHIVKTLDLEVTGNICSLKTIDE